MFIIRYLIDISALVFIFSFVYLIMLWTFFLESIPEHTIYILTMIFWILFIWMITLTFIGILKTIRYWRSL